MYSTNVFLCRNEQSLGNQKKTSCAYFSVKSSFILDLWFGPLETESVLMFLNDSFYAKHRLLINEVVHPQTAFVQESYLISIKCMRNLCFINIRILSHTSISSFMDFMNLFCTKNAIDRSLLAIRTHRMGEKKFEYRFDLERKKPTFQVQLLWAHVEIIFMSSRSQLNWFFLGKKQVFDLTMDWYCAKIKHYTSVSAWNVGWIA